MGQDNKETEGLLLKKRSNVHFSMSLLYKKFNGTTMTEREFGKAFGVRASGQF